MQENHWRITTKEEGFSLWKFLKTGAISSLSSRQIKKMIEEGGCSLNGKVNNYPSYRLKKGDLVNLSRTIPPARKPSEKIEKKQIVYEDDVLIVINKPVGFICEQASLVKQFEQPVYLVHRLDKETSGLLILAKNHQAKKILEKQFHQREIQKAYLAIIWGKVNKPVGNITNLLRVKRSQEGQTVWGSGKSGVRAETEWKVLKTDIQTTLIQLMPKSGRTHQLRVHMSEWGHPIIGDIVYGKKVRGKGSPDRCLLHAAALRFSHPVTKKTIDLQAPPPEDFQNYQSTFGLTL